MDRAYHDTYYVVAHGHYLWSLALVALVLVLLWWIVLAAHPRLGRLRRPTFALLAVGSFGIVLPLFASFLPPRVYLDHPSLFIWVNNTAKIGALLILLALVVTTVCLLLGAFARLKR